MKRTKISAALLALYALPLAAQTPADGDEKSGRAADEAPELQTLHVRASKKSDYKVDRPYSPLYTEPVVDTPQTLIEIPEAVYRQQVQTTLRDALRNTPGITIQQGEGGSAPGDNLFIRGFGARNDIYVDGLRDPGILSRDVFNVERIEVAQGPASALVGRGSTGAAVNMVTKSAGLKDFFNADAILGSGDYYRTTADLNQRIGEHSGLRLNALYQDAGVVNRDVVQNRSWGFAPSLALGLGTPTELQFDYEHLSQDNIPDYGLPLSTPGVNGGAAGAGNPPVSLRDLDWDNFYGLADRDFEHIERDIGTIIVKHTLESGWQLRNIARYGRNGRDATITPPRAVSATATGGLNDPGYDPTVPQIRRTDTKYQDRSDEIFADQITFSGSLRTGWIEHDVVTGLQFSREKSISYGKADLCAPADGSQPTAPGCNGRPPVTSLYDPDPYQPYTAQIVRTGAYGKATGDSGAAFAFDTLKFGRRWQLSGGLRFERFRVGVDSVTPASGTTPASVAHLQRTDNLLSWRGALLYKPTAEGSLYAAAGNSFNPSADGSQGLTLSTVDGRGRPSQNNPNLAPEETRAYEAGVKWELFDERLLATAALFRSDKQNARTNGLDPVSGNIVTVVYGKQRVQGVQLGLSGNITDEWAAFGGYMYMDSDILRSGTQAEIGRPLQYVPRNSATLWTTYRLPHGVTVGGGTQYSSGYFFTNTALDPADAQIANRDYIGSLTGYLLFNAMASWQVNRNLELRLNVNNLTDERYVGSGYQGHFVPGVGRTVFGTVSVHF